MLQIATSRVGSVFGMLGAVVVLGACAAEERFGYECREGDCPAMLEITDDLMDQVEVQGSDAERQRFELPAHGERLVFSGTYKRDSESANFEFEGRAGQWVAITVYSRGVVDPTFRVRDFHGYIRWNLTYEGEQGMARRVMMLPRDGVYRLDVLSNVRGEESMNVDYGGYGEDSHFVGVVKTLAPPPARPLEVDGRAMEERFLHVDSGLFDIRGAGDGPVGVWVESFHDDGHPVYGLRLVKGDLRADGPELEVAETPIRHAPVLWGLVDPALGTQVHVDTATHTNTHGWYRIGARSLNGFEPGEEQRAQITGEAGQIVVAFHRNWSGEKASLELSREGEVVVADADRPGIGEQSLWIGPSDMAVYLEEAATFEAVLTNPQETPLYNAKLKVEVKEPLAVWEVRPTTEYTTLEYRERMDARRSEFVLLDVKEPTEITFHLSGGYVARGPSSSRDMDLYIYAVDSPDEPIVASSGPEGERGVRTLDEGRYLLHAHPYAPQIAGFQLSASFSAP
ncbi:hypothetical protein FRC91_18085 [Bradymonadales bacterium TMQ1]|nr:hypothetical protein FRC91_18085 [Bradymonadales bacterium TMQ1]